MNGTEAIINKILSDAKEKAKSIEDTSVYNHAMREKAHKDWAEEFLRAQRVQLKEECSQLIDRKVTLAGLDKRKLLLKTKQDLIDEVLNLAHEKMCKMKKDDYLAFVLKLIRESADDGDEIVLSKDGVLCERDFKGTLNEKHLSISSERGDFVGGVILIGKNCDKDLTFRSILNEKKDYIVTETVKEIFG